MKKEVMQNQSERITKLSQRLRVNYYKTHENIDSYYTTPSGMRGNYSEADDMIGSIGPWPEFIMRGTFCCRTLKGYCSPCFYSQFSLKNRELGEDYNDMVRAQINAVINNFDKEVYKRQYGWDVNVYYSEREISFVLTPTGSYFDGNEFPQNIRIEMLEKIVKIAELYEEPTHFMIESHCKDFLALDFKSSATKHELELLRKLNTTILFGFESANEYVRNVLYNKHLSMEEIMQTYSLMKMHGLQMGVFIFAGLFSMNDALTHKDVTESIEFSVSKNIAPVIMFQNIQQNTINELLYDNGTITLLEPYTVMDIVTNMIKCVRKYGSVVDWLIADPKGGPPAPKYNIFDCAKITPQRHSELIYDLIVHLRKYGDFNYYEEKVADIRKSQDYRKYLLARKEMFDEKTLVEKTNNLLEIAEAVAAERGIR